MSHLKEVFQQINNHKKSATLHVQTMGNFVVWRHDEIIDNKEWGRDKTLQLFQFLISNRHRHGLHKEQIMDRLWEDSNDRDFKVALHGINKALEPDRTARSEPEYIIRQGLSYQLAMDKIWVDIEALEKYVILANEALHQDETMAIASYKEALRLHQGAFLPDRLYEDWSSEERERIQVLILGAYVTLAELLLPDNPIESIRLAQNALSIDSCWEDAYRIQMQAYLNKGNRPQAIKTYNICKEVLDREYGITPLPATKKLFTDITHIS